MFTNKYHDIPVRLHIERKIGAFAGNSLPGTAAMLSGQES
jgi:hypothetical protein